MDPIELVRRDLGAEAWDTMCESSREPIQEVADQNPFSRHRLFVTWGRTGQFDFPTLPHGSYGYYAADGRSATRLTHRNKEIRAVLADEWEALRVADPVRLASLILKFSDAGIKASHHVVRDADALRAFGNREHSIMAYELNEKEFAKALPEIGSTRSAFDGERLSLRAVTLCGWMHDKQNLGVESIAVRSDGSVLFAERQVLSTHIFSRVPAIVY